MKVERHLVLGAARSGKTRHALSVASSLAEARGAPVMYVATAEAGDAEMHDRIQRHRRERPAHWHTLEAPRDLGRALMGLPEETVIVVDCLTLWLSNALLKDFSDEAPMRALPGWSAECETFDRYLAAGRHDIVLVSNEVGAGIVPMAPVARRFQDEQGRLNQAVARACDRVTLVVAGLPLSIK